MKIIKNQNWIKGETYQKRILLSGFNKQINLVEDVIVPGNSNVPMHTHDFSDEIFYIVKNSALMIVEDKEFEVREGDIIYVDKNERHGFENKTDSELKILVMKVNFKEGDSHIK